MKASPGRSGEVDAAPMTPESNQSDPNRELRQNGLHLGHPIAANCNHWTEIENYAKMVSISSMMMQVKAPPVPLRSPNSSELNL
ncbi:unnamed protein product [Bursaphelenchus xylophilus]|uniref:(pine wood nematode) hypothetical protein n=1 Tax=Bursaphelenchus xylophilus TaxID=6326 RepID=A0A7I8XQU6_BURXY|nr:unnamed protein product [Bursaphelenchus xylophilus]CAG9088589.1 unnamed protein product [Bursaphelenchus xylophilus]